nr:hypothetical protein HmN_000902700 [Hymenolepis microstoma]
MTASNKSATYFWSPSGLLDDEESKRNGGDEYGISRCQPLYVQTTFSRSAHPRLTLISSKVQDGGVVVFMLVTE